MERAPSSSPPRPPRPPEPDRICGLAAVSAVFARRPRDVLRLFHLPSRRREANPFCSVMAQMRKPYREVGEEELARVAGTVHHGGIVAVTARRKVPQLALPLAPALRAAPVLPVLDGVSNPHNLGAIARSAAFFGCIGMVVSGDPRQAGLSDAAWRTSEGGLEVLSLWSAPALPSALPRLGVMTVAAVARGGVAPENLPPADCVALVLGNEEQGVSERTAAACDARVTLPGSGRVESLNVSVAAAVLIHALSARRS
ncbi:TrmH family RNA methyltransferase [Roseomonas xinghualingensis]|uniref:TrmH family RNA methyltransferase n=1 Tax=Roseomonas xinghualingensis TaxID=2986475 RepID=UPI0021F1564B|nr:RNA methyltransferase [Roseomonas sp. SXEYE001]MCV4207906.1 RNA methyltransferase [Roseomonas sp. SXEYE001]